MKKTRKWPKLLGIPQKYLIKIKRKWIYNFGKFIKKKEENPQNLNFGGFPKIWRNRGNASKNERFDLFPLIFGPFPLIFGDWRLPIEERACRKTHFGGGDYSLRNSGLLPLIAGVQRKRPSSHPSSRNQIKTLDKNTQK